MAIEIKKVIERINSSSRVEYKVGSRILASVLNTLEGQGLIPPSVAALKEELKPVSSERNTKKRFRIGEAAGMIGVSPRALRNYADKGFILYTRLPSGHRVFSESSIGDFKRKMIEAGRDPSVWTSEDSNL